MANLKRYYDEDKEKWISIVDNKIQFEEDNYFFPMYRSYAFSLKNYHCDEIKKNPMAYRIRCLRHMSIEVNDVCEWERVKYFLKMYPIELFVSGTKKPWELENINTEVEYSF